VPHGSAIEYTVRLDPRFAAAARKGLDRAAGVVWISDEVRARVHALFPETFRGTPLAAQEHMVGIGTDTSLFRPIDPCDRDDARAELASMQRAGGRTLAQRRALADAVVRGDIDATRRDWEAYDHDVEDADLAQRLTDIPTGGDLVAFVGSLTWGKGVQTLVAAMPQLLARRPDAHLLVVGSGTFREVLEALVAVLDGGHRDVFARLVQRGRSLDRGAGEGGLDDLAAYAESHEGRTWLWSATGLLARRVHFIGRLDHPRLRLVLPWAKVAAFCSIVKEASPLVFAEALAAGVLPAAAAHSGFRDGLNQLRDAMPPQLWPAMCLPTATEHRVAGTADQLATLLAREPDQPSADHLRAIALQRYDWAGVAQRLSSAATTIAHTTS
jgi:glycosyltransferase involved in cell wall biosynthesis